MVHRQRIRVRGFGDGDLQRHSPLSIDNNDAYSKALRTSRIRGAVQAAERLANSQLPPPPASAAGLLRVPPQPPNGMNPEQWKLYFGTAGAGGSSSGTGTRSAGSQEMLKKTNERTSNIDIRAVGNSSPMMMMNNQLDDSVVATMWAMFLVVGVMIISFVLVHLISNSPSSSSSSASSSNNNSSATGSTTPATRVGRRQPVRKNHKKAGHGVTVVHGLDAPSVGVDTKKSTPDLRHHPSMDDNSGRPNNNNNALSYSKGTAGDNKAGLRHLTRSSGIQPPPFNSSSGMPNKTMMYYNNASATSTTTTTPSCEPKNITSVAVPPPPPTSSSHNNNNSSSRAASASSSALGLHRPPPPFERANGRQQEENHAVSTVPSLPPPPPPPQYHHQQQHPVFRMQPQPSPSMYRPSVQPLSGASSLPSLASTSNHNLNPGDDTSTPPMPALPMPPKSPSSTVRLPDATVTATPSATKASTSTSYGSSGKNNSLSARRTKSRAEEEDEFFLMMEEETPRVKNVAMLPHTPMAVINRTTKSQTQAAPPVRRQLETDQDVYGATTAIRFQSSPTAVTTPTTPLAATTALRTRPNNNSVPFIPPLQEDLQEDAGTLSPPRSIVDLGLDGYLVNFGDDDVDVDPESGNLPQDWSNHDNDDYSDSDSFTSKGFAISPVSNTSSNGHGGRRAIALAPSHDEIPVDPMGILDGIDDTEVVDSDGDDVILNDPGRPQIDHGRPNLTMATDVTSVMERALDYTELDMQEVIGGGGFGQVWRANWLGTPVAVKILNGSAQAVRVPRAVLEEFAAEINLLSGMKHPNVCLYLGAVVTPPHRAIVTELAANGSLWDALRLPLMPPYVACTGSRRSRGGCNENTELCWPESLYQPDPRYGAPPIIPMPSLSSTSSQQLSSPSPYNTGSAMSTTVVRRQHVPPKGTWPWVLVKRVAVGAARGMAYLHAGGTVPVLHRDLKSANILLDESYTPKVCDFGLSRLKAQEKSMTGNCGTVQWMAPEVLATKPYNEKADVYSYGIICWELLTRECPFDGMPAVNCAIAVLHEGKRPVIPKWCPQPLFALIRACIKTDPNERPSFAQVLEAFERMPA